MSQKRLHSLILLILMLVVIRGLIYSLVIPFDQSPDEYHYFKLIKARQLQLDHASAADRQQAAAQLALFRAYALRPDANPEKYTLRDFSDEDLPKPPPSHQIYYLTTAWLLKLISFEDVKDEVYLIRGVSILCGFIIVGIAFLLTRELFPDHTFLIVSVPLLITFIPQFSAMNGVITSDKFTEVCGAVLCLLMVNIFKRGMKMRYLIPYLLVMAVALLNKRTGIFTIPVFVMLLFVFYWKSSLGLRMHLVLFGLLAAIAFGANSLAWYLEKTERFQLTAESLQHLRKKDVPQQITDKLTPLLNRKIMGEGRLLAVVKAQIGDENADKYYEDISDGVEKIVSPLQDYTIWVSPHKIAFWREEGFSSAMLVYYAKFFIVLYWSFWGVFGYMTIHLHHFWYMLIASAQVLAICGLMRFAFQVKTNRRRLESWQRKTLYLCGANIVILLLIVMMRSIILSPLNPFLAQGRRFFAVLIPIGLFTMLGLDLMLPHAYRRWIGGLGLLGLIVLDVVCISNYILLNFYNISFF